MKLNGCKPEYPCGVRSWKKIFLDMSGKRTGRLQIGALSEFFEDLLRADSFLANNSLASQGKSLLQSYLGQKEAKIKERITYLAQKRNISFEEMWQQVQNGTASQMSKEELSDLEDND